MIGRALLHCHGGYSFGAGGLENSNSAVGTRKHSIGGVRQYPQLKVKSCSGTIASYEFKQRVAGWRWS